jgi:hypothetical protein
MYSFTTGSDVIQTVFPLRVGRSGPKILLALATSVGVTVQFLVMFERTMFLKSVVGGYPTSPSAFRALFARS